MKTNKVKIERGSGNVFADLGLPEAEAHLLKAELVTRIDKIIRQRGLKQVEAAKLLGLSQPDVSRLLRGSFEEFSMERLLRLLTALGRDVEIVIREPRSKRQQAALDSVDAYSRIACDATAFERSAVLIENEIVMIGAAPSDGSPIGTGRFRGWNRNVVWECLKSASHFNLGVSFELRLKCLLHLENPDNPPGNIHDIGKLLCRLPTGIRKQLSAVYRQEKERHPFELTAVRPWSAPWPSNPPPCDKLESFCAYLGRYVDVAKARYSWETVATGECRFYVDKTAGIFNFLKRVGDLASKEAQRQGFISGIS